MGKLEEVIILAGGKGTRLRPLTETIPKPMVEIRGKPFLEYKIEQIKMFGGEKIILCTGYLGDHIKNYFGDGKKWGIEINYAQEKELLGTAGAIKNAEPFIEGDSFIVTNGDTHSYLNFNDLFSFHNKHPFLMTMVITRSSNPKEQELIETKNGIVTNIYQRNTGEHAKLITENSTPYVNAGTYAFDKDFLSLIPSNTHSSLEQDIFPKLVGAFVGFKYDGYLKDIANISLLDELKMHMGDKNE